MLSVSISLEYWPYKETARFINRIYEQTNIIKMLSNYCFYLCAFVQDMEVNLVCACFLTKTLHFYILQYLFVFKLLKHNRVFKILIQCRVFAATNTIK